MSVRKLSAALAVLLILAACGPPILAVRQQR